MHVDMYALVVKSYRKGVTLPDLEAALERGCPRAIKAVKIDPSSYSSAHDFSVHYCFQSILKKYKGAPVDDKSRRESATRLWLEAESRCRLFNQSVIGNFPYGAVEESVISTARQRIFDILGRLKLHDVLRDCRHGPGATSSVKRRAGIDKKIASKISISRLALPYLRLALNHDPHFLYSRCGVMPEGPFTWYEPVDIVDANRLEFVPKDSLVDRPICCEPTGNAYLQAGAGRFIRRRLLRVGVDLSRQEQNQELARIAYGMSFATLDLSSASDTMSWGIVKLLLPEDWFQYLNAIRSPATSFQGKEIHLEKFVSMGNGYAFELETLIFWALASAAAEKMTGLYHPLVSTYGDDIIVEARAYEDVRTILSWAGFVVNDDKSFATGPFYESCGKHYFKGIDVTPIYMKEVVDRPEELIRAHNRIIRWQKRNVGHERFGPLLKVLLSSWPFPRVPQIPDCPSANDDGFLTSADRITAKFSPNHGFSCLTYVYVAGHRRSYFEDSLLWYGLKGRYVSPSSNGRCCVSSEGAYKFKVAYRHAY